MPDWMRRDFLMAGAALAVSAPDLAAQESAPRLWIDPALRNLPKRPWRKIHLDFHNSHHVTRIGERFHADEFGDTLLKANVDSVVVFAKDMHGYFYYPSRFGPVHPGLSFDLLGAQVEACRKRKIAVYAYYCVTWDHDMAGKRREWLALRKDGSSFLPRAHETPGWTALCLSHEAFVELVLEHAREFTGRYPLDGAWFDMPWPRGGECWCAECLRQMKARGMDPDSRQDQRLHKHELYRNFLRRATEAVRTARPGCQVDYNEQGGYHLNQRVQYLDNFDIEALPTGQWGYYFFPAVVRHARTHAITTYGMTGRFQSSWADFGGLKLPRQLEIECAAIAAQTARCDIGDQMPPNGRLDPAVYHVIGQVYARIKELEPYLEGAAPATEAAILTSGLPFDKPATEPNYGLMKLLVESRIQFDIVEPHAPWERYALLVLSDELEVDAALAGRLHRFVASGGALLVSHNAALVAGAGQGWLDRYGLHYAGQSPFVPAYMIPKSDFTGSIPAYEYALYEGAAQWKAEAPAVSLAALGEPAFQRSPQRYTSHRQTPFDHETPFTALARSGRVGLAAFPLGLSYFKRGYWVYRAAFQHLLKQVLPVQAIETNAPLSTEITLTHQDAAPGRRERFLVHVLNFSPLRHSPHHPVFYEDPIPLTDVKIRLRVPREIAAARTIVHRAALGLARIPGGVEVSLPRVTVHEVVAFEVG